MGIFGLGKKRETKEEQVYTVKVNLEKAKVNLEKTVVNLSKERGVDLSNLRARVAVVMDYSGSMTSRYRSGEVDKTLCRILPIALKFDDNGELDAWAFSDFYKRMDTPITENNCYNYVSEVIECSGIKFGGTNYEPPIRDMLFKYFKESDDKTPVFVLFITDGDNQDKVETNSVIRESAKYNIFIQFVGIGRADMNYLEELDDLDGRVVDNTGFIRVNDIMKLDDTALYTKLLDQFPEWLKAKGLQ